MKRPTLQRESPYQGLTPYDESDAPYFFGREKETKLISASLFASSLTLLYGASGVGKSSILRAGVVNALRPRKDVLVVVFNQWQGDPLRELIAAIAKAATPLIGNKAARKKFSSQSSRQVSLKEFLLACATSTKRRLMLILDQFEEYSLYHPQDDAFARELPTAIAVGDLSASFLLSLREDSLAGLDRFEGRIPTLFSNFRRIDHLDRAAAKKAIMQPIAQYNKLNNLETDPITIETELVQQVLQQVRTGQVLVGETGVGALSLPPESDHSSRIETPYLQLVMTRLWNQEINGGSRRLRNQTLSALGGAQRIVLTHLDAVMAKFTDDEKELLARIFNLLVTPSGTKIAHMVRDLADYAGISTAQLKPILDKLSRGSDRILRPVASLPDYPDEPRYEIFHDRLGAAILDWRSRYLHEQELLKSKRQEAEQRLFSQSYVEKLLDKLEANERQLAADALKFLVTPSGVKVTQRLKDLAEYMDVATTKILPVLQRLSDPNDGILTSITPPDGRDRYEIRHDALVPAVLSWRARYLDEQEQLKRHQPKTVTPPESRTPGQAARGYEGGSHLQDTDYFVMRDLLHRGKIVPFIGPGVTARPLGGFWREGANFIPLPSELARFLATLVDFPHEAQADLDLDTVASYVEAMAGREFLHQELQHIFSNPALDPSPVHKYLAGVAQSCPLTIVTSNYDNLIERCFEQSGVPYDLVINFNPKHKEDFGPRVFFRKHDTEELIPVVPNQLVVDPNTTSVIYKINGSVNVRNPHQSSYIITNLDYLDSFLSGTGHSIPAVLAIDITQKAKMFLGWGLHPWQSRAFLRSLMGIPRTRSKSWSLLFHPSPVEDIFCRQMNIDLYREDLNEFAFRMHAIKK